MPRVSKRPKFVKRPAENVERVQKITPQQLDWCRFYVENGGRPTIAARAAGYKDAGASGSLCMKNPLCIAEVARRNAWVERKHELTIERVVAEYSKIAFADLGELLVEDEDGEYRIEPARMSAGHRAALTEFTSGKGGPNAKTTMKFGSKQAALDALARFLGMNNDKLEVTGTLTMAERISAGRKRASIRNTPEELEHTAT